MVIITLIFTLICISATSLFLTITFLILKIFAGKSIADNSYPPIKGTVFNLILHYGRIYDHQTELAAESPTFRLLSPDTSEVFTTDTRNIEHVLKTRFESYSKGEHNRERAVDLFGQGIFVVDGDKWRHQRRLAGFEFSARFLRVFSCDVFRRNAAKLVRVVSQFSASNEAFDMQVSQSVTFFFFFFLCVEKLEIVLFASDNIIEMFFLLTLGFCIEHI